jgi:hypothetical protein
MFVKKMALKKCRINERGGGGEKAKYTYNLFKIKRGKRREGSGNLGKGTRGK